MMGRKIGLIIFHCLFVLDVQGQQVRKYANDFLNLGAGARGAGMGNTQVAVVDDVTAGYWNPAGLVSIKTGYELGMMHAEYFAGSLGYNYVGLAARIDTSYVVGFSVLRLGADNIPDTRALIEADGSINYENITSFSSQDYAFLGTYARKVNVKKFVFNVGGNLKVVHRAVGDFGTAWGVGLDLGTQLHFKKWHLGLMLRDVSGTYTQWNFNTNALKNIALETGADSVRIAKSAIETAPPTALIDLAYQFQVLKWNFLLSTGGDITWDGKRQTLLNTKLFSIAPRTGIEISYQEKIFFRTGLQNFQVLRDFKNQNFLDITPTFGMGFRVRNITIDYALTRSTESNAMSTVYSHIFSLRAHLKKQKRANL